MTTLLSHDDLRAKGHKKSRTQTWRDVKAKRFPPPLPDAGLANKWAEEHIDYFNDLLAVGFDRETATAMVAEKIAQKRAALLAAASP